MPNVYKELYSLFVSLACFWSGRSLPLGNQWAYWFPEWGPNVVGSPVLPSPNFPLHLFLLDGRKRVGHGVPGGWYVVLHQGPERSLGKCLLMVGESHTPRALKDLPHILFLTIPSLQMLYLSFYPIFWPYFQNFFLFSSLWPFWQSSFRSWEILCESLTWWYTAVGTEGLSIPHSMPHAGTPPGLPGRRGVFSCWCKLTSGLGVLRIRSHYSTFFALPFPAISSSLP